MAIISTFIILLIYYLIGAFPTGYLIAKHHGINLYRQGSGNVGATNVARVVGKVAGLATLIIDCSKGFFPLWLAYLFPLNPRVLALCAVALVAGHCFSIPKYLRGGKGVATSLGTALYLCLPGALVGVAVFAAVFSASRIVSLASVSAVLLTPLFALATGYADTTTLPLVVIGLLVVYRHKLNLKRLIEGTEAKFSTAKKPAQ